MLWGKPGRCLYVTMILKDGHYNLENSNLVIRPLDRFTNEKCAGEIHTMLPTLSSTTFKTCCQAVDKLILLFIYHWKAAFIYRFTFPIHQNYIYVHLQGIPREKDF